MVGRCRVVSLWFIYTHPMAPVTAAADSPPKRL